MATNPNRAPRGAERRRLLQERRERARQFAQQPVPPPTAIDPPRTSSSTQGGFVGQPKTQIGEGASFSENVIFDPVTGGELVTTKDTLGENTTERQFIRVGGQEFDISGESAQIAAISQPRRGGRGGISASQVTRLIQEATSKQLKEQERNRQLQEFFQGEQEGGLPGLFTAEQDFAQGPLPGTPSVTPAAPGIPEGQGPTLGQRLIDLKPQQRFQALQQTGAFNNALENFRQENPGVDIDPENRTLQRLATRAIVRAERQGNDPSEELEKLFERERFQVARKGGVVKPISNLSQTAGGPVDTSVPQENNIESIYKNYSTSDISQTFSEMLNDPTAFADFVSADYQKQLLELKDIEQLQTTVAGQNALDTIRQLDNEIAEIQSFEDRYRGSVKAELEESLSFIDDQKRVAKMRLELEQQKLAAQAERTLRPLKERQGRLEGYLKVKMNLEGLTSSASGLSLMVSQLRAFDDFVAGTELQFSLAAKDLAIQSEELFLGYAAKSIDAKREARAAIRDIDAKTTFAIQDIERDQLRTATTARIDIANIVGEGIKAKRDATDQMNTRLLDIFKEVQSNHRENLKLANERQEKELERVRDNNKTFLEGTLNFLNETGISPDENMVATIGEISQKIQSGEVNPFVGMLAIRAGLKDNPLVQEAMRQKMNTRGFKTVDIDGTEFAFNLSTGEIKPLAAFAFGTNRVQQPVPNTGSLRVGQDVPGVGKISAPGGASGIWPFGVDVANAPNSAIAGVASAGGTVRFAGELGDFGNVVQVEMPDGTWHQYAHLNTFSVEQGDVLTGFENIGLMGNTGEVRKSDNTKPTAEELKQGRGTHLDFTVFRDGKAGSAPKAENSFPVEVAYSVLTGNGQGAVATDPTQVKDRPVDQRGNPIALKDAGSRDLNISLNQAFPLVDQIERLYYMAFPPAEGAGARVRGLTTLGEEFFGTAQGENINNYVRFLNSNKAIIAKALKGQKGNLTEEEQNDAIQAFPGRFSTEREARVAFEELRKQIIGQKNAFYSSLGAANSNFTIPRSENEREIRLLRGDITFAPGASNEDKVAWQKMYLNGEATEEEGRALGIIQ